MRCQEVDKFDDRGGCEEERGHAAMITSVRGDCVCMNNRVVMLAASTSAQCPGEIHNNISGHLPDNKTTCDKGGAAL